MASFVLRCVLRIVDPIPDKTELREGARIGVPMLPGLVAGACIGFTPLRITTSSKTSSKSTSTHPQTPLLCRQLGALP